MPASRARGIRRGGEATVFESAEVGNRIGKSDFEAQVPDLRVGLINAQFDLRDAGFPVIVLLLGDDRLSCDAVLDGLAEWTDTRYIDTNYFGPPTEEEAQRPRFWRYWRALPRRGRIGVFIGAWASRAIADLVLDEIPQLQYERRVDQVRAFESALAHDGALILKFWLHLSKDEFARRLKKVKKSDEAWQLDQRDWDILEHYDRVLEVGANYIRRTSTDHAPWYIVESTDDRYRDLTVVRTILESLTARLNRPAPAAAEAAPAPAGAPGSRGALDGVDLSAVLPRDKYKKKLEAHQNRLGRLARTAREKGLSSVLVFEGWDAAGKGGVIRRLTRPMSARDFRVVPVAAPTDEERRYHYLWRFWRYLPRAGQMLIFDRSWYGRVLVERIEGFASVAQWSRAYEEINDFEEQITDHGWPVMKFWLHIDADEQLRRFEAREHTAYKKHKITEEDYRNRERWDDYTAAVNEMVERTSTEIAPWHLVPANDKRHARVEVIKAVGKRLERALDER
jgi:polyphosphate:AMP phosphotransferase